MISQGTRYAVARWGLAVLFLSFLLSAAAATWFGPNSHSFVTMVIQGFVLVALLVIASALPAPKTRPRTRPDEDREDS